ncbi:MAG TPA: hypothetical protein VMH40_09130 [Myxococcaceae bacterium]|nr:hypothetical protein [Myxococcaceae bacterium]
MKRVLLAGLASFLFACGSSGPKAPELRSFSYGAPGTPDTTQSSTADTAQTSFQSIAGVGGQSSTPTSAPTLADELTSNLGQAAAVFAPLPAEVRTPVQNSALRGVRGAALTVGNSNCVSSTDTSVTYSNCSYNGDGFDGTLNGSISITPNQQITWDITYTISGSSQGVTVNGSFHWYGQLAWTSSTIKGYGRSEYAITASGNGQSAEVAYTAGFDVDVTYLSSPSYCIATGTLELRRVVAGASASQTGLHDGAWKFTWSGNGTSCGTLQVATGT